MKLRIGQWVHFGLGGADKAAQNLVKGLSELKDKIDLFIFYNDFSIPRSSSQWDENVIMLSRLEQYQEAGYNLKAINDFEALNVFNLDVLNTHRSGDDFWAFPGFEDKSFNFKIVETNFHGAQRTKCDIRIVPSWALQRRMSNQTKVIPNPINTPVTHETLKDKFPYLINKFIYGRIGRPCKEIFSDICLKAYKQIESEETFFIYFSPLPEVFKKIKELEINNIICIDQTINEAYISKFYNTCDVICHSNNMGETFGNTIAEAMIHGKPVVSHVGNNSWPQAQSELLGEMSNDLLIQENIVKNYSSVMQRLKDDKKFYDKCSNYLKNRADENYNYRIVTKQYISLYKSIVGGEMTDLDLPRFR